MLAFLRICIPSLTGSIVNRHDTRSTAWNCARVPPRLLCTAITISVVGTAKNSTELIDAPTNSPCDVVVSDDVMPGGRYGDGLALFAAIR